jgi:hypothetical protein
LRQANRHIFGVKSTSGGTDQPVLPVCGRVTLKLSYLRYSLPHFIATNFKFKRKKDNIMKYMAYCEEKQTIQHVSENSVSICVEQIYKIWSLGSSDTCALYIGWTMAKD